MSFATKVTAAVAVVILAAILVLVLARDPAAGRLEEQMRTAVGWAREGDAEKCIGLVARTFKQGDEDYERVCARIRGHIRPGAFPALELRSVEVTVDGSSARAVLFLRADAQGSIYSMGDARLELDLQLDGPDWKVTGYRLPRGADGLFK